MSKDLKETAATGRMNRCAFMGHASALGLSAAVAGSMMPVLARAQDAPVRGGVLRAGVQGG